MQSVPCSCIKRLLHNLDLSLSMRLVVQSIRKLDLLPWVSSNRIILCATLMALVLRVWRIDQLGQFDFDEVASVWYAKMNLVDTISAISAAPFEHPPAYYIALGYWIAVFGESEEAVRMFSVPAGVLMIPLTFLIGRRVFGRTSAVIGSFIVAASPVLIFYSREGRMYAYATLLGVLCLYLFMHAIEGRLKRYWVALAVVMVVGVFVDYSVLYALLAMNLFLMTERKYRHGLFPKFILFQIVPIGFLGVWLFASKGVAQSLPAWNTGNITHGLISHTLHVAWLDMTAGIQPIRGGRAAIGVGVLLGSAALIGWVGCLFSRKARILQFYSAAVLLGLIVLLLFDKEYQPRYLMMGVIPLALFAGSFLERVRLNTGMILGVTLILFVAGPLYASRQYYYGYERGDYGAITGAVRSLALPAPKQLDPLKYRDAVVLAGPWQGWFWRHYYPEFEKEIDVWFIPDQVPPAVGWQEVQDKLSRAATNHNRVWVVLSALRQSDPNGYVERWLNVNLWRARDSVYRNGILQLYLTDKTNMVSRNSGSLTAPNGFRIQAIEFEGNRSDQPAQPLGDGIRFTVRIENGLPLEYDMLIKVRLQNRIDGKSYGRDFYPLNVHGRRSSQWDVGERVVGKIGVWIPAAAGPGDYDAYVSVLDAHGQPMALHGNIAGINRTETGELYLGSSLLAEPRSSVPDDREIFELYGAPIHDR